MDNDLLKRDFKDRPSLSGRRRFRPVHFHAAAGLGVAVAVLALFWPGPEAVATRHDPVEVGHLPLGELTLPLALPRSTLLAPKETAQEPVIPWQEVTVKRGDTLSAIFDRQGLTAVQMLAVLNAGEEASKLRRLVPGQSLQFHVIDGRLEALRQKLSTEKALVIRREGEKFRVSIDERPIEIRMAYAAGEIDTSLFNSGKAAGLSDRLIMELVGIFGWDIDFALDIRQGDHFTLLFEERFLEGEKVEEGEIVAAEFVNQGRVHRAIRFTSPDGRSSYFDPDGHSMRKAFLRSPVDFRRISSKFQAERYHPVLGQKRPHRGVDYAAATGTPIKAAGDGKIVTLGWKGGYGRTIVIQHGGRYSTLYGHMSQYRSGLKVGSRVKQGQTIGYVGASGLATGPHLHYEFRVDGVHRNPLTVKLPQAEPIAAQHKAAFDAVAANLLGQLDVFNRTRLALGQ